MVSLDKLTDKQNILLTQLAYKSDVLNDCAKGLTIEELITTLPEGETKDLLKELFDAGLGSLRIKDVGNDSVSGFGAIAFTDDYGNTGFSFRGTDGPTSANDMIDNLHTYLSGTSVQTAQAEAFFDANMDPNGNNYLYGHSKGGELAESVYVNNYNIIKKVHLINPQPINPYSLSIDQLSAMQSSKVDIIIVEGDYVWFLGLLPSYGNIRIAKKTGGDSHYGFQLEYDDSGNIVECDQTWWEFPAAIGLAFISAGLQATGGFIGLIYNCTVRIIDFVKNNLIPAALEFISAVANALEQLGSKFYELASNLIDFLGSIIDQVRNWLRDNFDSGYKYAESHPQITLDTYKLQSYAQRLMSVNQRISNLDGRLDGLYWQVGLLDLWNLLQADLLTGYSWRLLRCAGYLNDTASDFDSAESNLINSL